MFTRLQLFQGTFKLIAIDLCKQQKLGADPKAIQKVNFLEIQKKIHQYFSLLKKRKK